MQVLVTRGRHSYPAAELIPRISGSSCLHPLVHHWLTLGRYADLGHQGAPLISCCRNDTLSLWKRHLLPLVVHWLTLGRYADLCHQGEPLISRCRNDTLSLRKPPSSPSGLTVLDSWTICRSWSPGCAGRITLPD